MSGTETISIEEADRLVLEHQGWAESIARSVARAWNMDWRLDGLDGAAMEALIFCARRFDTSRGIPFRGYARKRIHEASTEAARKSRGWRRGLNQPRAEQDAREISSELFKIFPELRSGELPMTDDGGGDGDGDMRAAIRHLLVGASIIAAKQTADTASPEDMVDYKRLVQLMASLEPVHQLLMWRVYWEGESMRTVATEWETDELNVIREHKVLLAHLLKCLSTQKVVPPPKIRPGLKNVALKLKRSQPKGCFTAITQPTR